VAEQQLSRQRDSQRSKVYKSDRSLDGISKPLPSVEDIEAYVAKTFASKQVRKAFKRCYWSLPEAIDGRSLKWAWADESVVFMPSGRDERASYSTNSPTRSPDESMAPTSRATAGSSAPLTSNWSCS
jgi:hypothetical protein